MKRRTGFSLSKKEDRLQPVIKKSGFQPIAGQEISTSVSPGETLDEGRAAIGWLLGSLPA
jgi:hypothetical protein